MRYADTLGFFAGQRDPQFRDEAVKLHVLSTSVAGSGSRTMKTIEATAKKAIAQFESQETVRIARTASDVALLDDDKTDIVLGIQAPPEDETLTRANLEELYAMGLRFITIAYDRANRYGSGFVQPNVGLTDAGRMFLQACAEAQLTVDLSHAGHQTAADALAFAKAQQLPPLVATHTACYDVYHHLRNLPDRVIRGIAEYGGFVGIVSLTSFLIEREPHTRSGIDAFLNHVRHAVDVCGEAAVCVGSDGYYTRRDEEEWQKMHEELSESLKKRGATFDVRWPDQPLAWTRPDRMVLVYEELRSALGEETARKVVGDNFIHFLLTHLR